MIFDIIRQQVETLRRPLAAVVPSAALRLNQNWTRLEQLDQQMLDAAWRYGAWNLVREEHRGCLAVGVPSARASRAAATSSGGSTTSC